MNIQHRGAVRRRLAVTGAFVLAAAGPLAACGDDSSDTASDSASETTAATAVTVSDQWARTGTAGGTSAVYMELTGGDEDDALVGASVPADVAGDTQIHETVTDGAMAEDDTSTSAPMAEDDTSTSAPMADGEMSDGEMGDDSEGEMEGDHGGSGMMSMQEVESIAIPAGETVALEPGGFHVMLLDLKADLAVGDSVEVTLKFESGREETVTAEVREA